MIDINTVAICMATYNGEAYVSQQIDSIINQTYKDWVLFIRDDNSTDKTLEILRQYAAQWQDKVILIEDTSVVGGSAKQNFAAILSWVTGHYDFSYFMFADQDDVWLNDKIQKTLQIMQKAEKESQGPTVLYRQHGNNVVGATKVNSLWFIQKRLSNLSHVRKTFRIMRDLIQNISR